MLKAFAIFYFFISNGSAALWSVLCATDQIALDAFEHSIASGQFGGPELWVEPVRVRYPQVSTAVNTRFAAVGVPATRLANGDPVPPSVIESAHLFGRIRRRAHLDSPDLPQLVNASGATEPLVIPSTPLSDSPWIQFPTVNRDGRRFVLSPIERLTQMHVEPAPFEAPPEPWQLLSAAGGAQLVFHHSHSSSVFKTFRLVHDEGPGQFTEVTESLDRELTHRVRAQLLREQLARVGIEAVIDHYRPQLFMSVDFVAFENELATISNGYRRQAFHREDDLNQLTDAIVFLYYATPRQQADYIAQRNRALAERGQSPFPEASFFTSWIDYLAKQLGHHSRQHVAPELLRTEAIALYRQIDQFETVIQRALNPLLALLHAHQLPPYLVERFVPYIGTRGSHVPVIVDLGQGNVTYAITRDHHNTPRLQIHIRNL